MPDMRSPSDLPSTEPAAAYAADVTRLARASIAFKDEAWLMLTHSLRRMSTLAPDEMRTIAPDMADALAATALAVGDSETSRIMQAARALRRVPAANIEWSGDSEEVTEFVHATQSVAEELELAGGFALAYAMLAGLDAAFARSMDPRHLGNLRSQQGRAVRQLGVVDLARELYAAALQQGHASDAKDVVARAQLGLAVIALTHGNYPVAHEQFRVALVNAELSNHPDLIRSAHHGLMNCGFGSGNLDAAMVHGWNVLRLCIAPDARAEALMNLAEICKLTGEHEAALRVFIVAMEWTSIARVRLHAMSGALHSAIMLKKHEDARRYAAEITALLPTVPDTFARAAIGIEIADSLHRLGDSTAAAGHLAEAQMLAAANSYHELVHRAEQTVSTWRATALEGRSLAAEAPRRTARRSEPFRTVLRSLNGLTAVSV